VHALPRHAEWIHVAAVRRDDGAVLLYADGAEIGRGESGPGHLGPSRNPLIIGAAINGPAPEQGQSKFQGKLDELLIYDRALAPAEIAALAHKRRP
jgi:hypothetical protein